MSADKKCPNCGACKECGAKPQIVPMPYPVYPYQPWTIQPLQPWSQPQPRPYWFSTSGNAVGNQIGGTGFQSFNAVGGNYQ